MNRMYVLFILRKEESHPSPYGVGDFRYIQELIQGYVEHNHFYGKGTVDFRIEDFERYYSKVGERQLLINRCITCKNNKHFYESEACKECKMVHKPINYCGAFEPRKEVVKNGK